MRIAIFTLGTRGDVQPYIALAVEAIKRGHSAVICTGESFKDLIKSYNIEFSKADLDLMELLESKDGQDIFNNASKHIIKAIKYSKEYINPAYRKTLEQFYNCAKSADVIVYHPKALGAPDIAISLNIPCIHMPPVPIVYPVEEFPNLAISYKGNFGSIINKLTYLPIKYAEASYIKEINDFRQKILKLPKRKCGIYTYNVESKPIPLLYPVSKFIFEDVNSWSKKVYLSGFLFIDSANEQLSDEIKKFISNGNAPIIISFSSMPLKNPLKFKEVLIKALKETNNRAIVLTGTSGMNFDNADNILSVKSAPHSLLFPLSKGIVHHGGVGTMATALKSGKPQLIMPFSVDQPFWANRLYKMGYALKPMYETNISINDLSQAFIDMDSSVNINRAISIKSKLDTENGNINAIKFIENICLKN
ncbi:glycosyltransferase [Paraclostridium bifermentans]|uniref:glycosyltransferase n=1 Tax=Paraclostridium bifermentans TaxID=1490 RepID=UPI00359C706B